MSRAGMLDANVCADGGAGSDRRAVAPLTGMELCQPRVLDANIAESPSYPLLVVRELRMPLLTASNGLTRARRTVIGLPCAIGARLRIPVRLCWKLWDRGTCLPERSTEPAVCAAKDRDSRSGTSTPKPVTPCSRCVGVRASRAFADAVGSSRGLVMAAEAAPQASLTAPVSTVKILWIALRGHGIEWRSGRGRDRDRCKTVLNASASPPLPPPIPPIANAVG